MSELVRFEDGDDLSTSPRRGDGDSLFCWTIFILFLIFLAAFCWLGSYYIFGCPEKPLSYKALRKLRKLENIQKFELTTAPKGEFLDPKALFQRYGAMDPGVLENANARLLRNFIRNYRGTCDLVPYVVGTYTILDSFELNARNLFSSGVVAIAQSADAPNMLLESVFTARQRVVPLLRRTLLTGLSIRLERRFDLSALIHVKRAADGRMLFTTLPILYGSYSSCCGPGNFSLSPPDFLNVKAGLPVLSQEEIEAASKTYYLHCRQSKLGTSLAKSRSPHKKGAPPSTPASSITGSARKGQLIRIERPVFLPEKTAEGVVPVQVDAVSPTSVEFTRSSREITSAASSDRPENPPLASSSVSYIPSRIYSTAKLPTSFSTRSWQTYKAGQMPLGRLVEVSEIQQFMKDRLWNERVYLRGNFRVTASCHNRAVLRPQGFRPLFFPVHLDGKIRVVVEFPSHSSVPKLGSSLYRGRRRPFLIVDVQRSLAGTTDIFAKEITHD